MLSWDHSAGCTFFSWRLLKQTLDGRERGCLQLAHTQTPRCPVLPLLALELRLFCVVRMLSHLCGGDPSPQAIQPGLHMEHPVAGRGQEPSVIGEEGALPSVWPETEPLKYSWERQTLEASDLQECDLPGG